MNDRIDAPARFGTGRLLQALGVGFGIAVIIGNTIGAGILRTPGEVAARLPDPWFFLAIWVAGGLYAFMGAISMAELGTMIPRSGGQYVFVRHGLGEFAGFVVGWSDWLGTCGTTAAVSIIVGEYTTVLFPALAGMTVPIALTTAISLALLQWRGIAWGRRAQEITALAKTLAFLAIILACMIFGSRPETVAPVAMPEGPTLLLSVIIALQAVIFTYDGWTGVIYFSEEVKNPSRDIPRALLGGVVAVIAIYLAVNLALLYVMPISQIAGQKLAVAAAAGVVFGEYGDTIIRGVMIVSLISGINALHLMSTRVIFAMASDGLFWRKLTVVNRGGTPSFALLLSTIIATAFIASGTFEQVIAALAFFFVANYVLSFSTLFVLRWREPEAPRPFRAWGYPWTTGLALAGSLAFLGGAIWSDTRNSIGALILLALSYPIFLAFRRFRDR